MESPFKTPEGSEEFLKRADKIARRDLRMKDNIHGRHKSADIKAPAGLSEEQQRKVLYGDRIGEIDFSPKEPRDLTAFINKQYKHLLNKLTPNEAGKKTFSSLDMRAGPFRKEVVIAEMLKLNLIKKTGVEVQSKTTGPREVYEIIENTEEIKDK